MIILLIALAFFTAWLFFIVRTINKIIYKTLKFTETPDPNIEERFKPFQRFDRKLWNITEMYFCGIFLLPIRVIFIVLIMLLLSLFIQVIIGFNSKNYREEYPLWKYNMIIYASRFVSRSIMFFSGIYWIDKKYAKISDYDKDYPLAYKELEKKNQRAPIVISNHITWIDIMYHSSTDRFPSFLSKKEVQNIPLFGTAAKALQCIFVDRASRQNKNQVREALHERGEQIKAGKNFPSIIIFPEGTTSNGTHLISFKKGAFEPLLPIKMVCIDYPIRNFNVALDIIGEGLNVLLVMCQLSNNISVIEFDTYYPNHLNLSHERITDWEIYARKLKNIMLQAMPHKKNSESGFRDAKELKKKIHQLQKKRKSCRIQESEKLPTLCNNTDCKKD